MAQGIFRAVYRDAARAADIDHTELTALQKAFGVQRIPGWQGDGFLDGHSAACNNTVDMAVYRFDLVGLKQILDQEFLTKTRRIIIPDVFGLAAFRSSM